MMKEFNPNHPVTQELHDQWYKLCAVLIYKSGATEADITVADLEGLMASGLSNITMRPHGDTITLRLVSEAEVQRLAKQAGGLPV